MKQVVVLGVLTVVLAGVLAARAESKQQRPAGYWAKVMIAKYFPRAHRAEAFKIIGCETGYTFSRWVTGAAGERGWFQWLPSNHGRVVTWRNRSARINLNRARELKFSTRVSAIWSKGGSDWSEWSCRRVL